MTLVLFATKEMLNAPPFIARTKIIGRSHDLPLAFAQRVDRGRRHTQGGRHVSTSFFFCKLERGAEVCFSRSETQTRTARMSGWPPSILAHINVYASMNRLTQLPVMHESNVIPDASYHACQRKGGTPHIRTSRTSRYVHASRIAPYSTGRLWCLL